VSIDEHYIIDTPENIEFSYDMAGIGSRFLAAIIDTLLLIIIQIALTVAMLALMGMIEGMFGDTGTSLLAAVWGLLGFIFLWGYYAFFEMVWNGQSPGKRVIRLRVVRDGGRPITFVATAIRNLVRIIDFLPAFYGLGVLAMFIDRRARRLGDLAGGTIVVKERAAVSLESLTARAETLPMPPLSEALPPNMLPNLHTLSDTDYDLIQEFLRRRKELGSESRQRLGWQLAQGLNTRIGVRVNFGDQESFLERLARDYRLTKQHSESSQRVQPQQAE
jgi:uncharacterized RDD family membrane protein YckC